MVKSIEQMVKESEAISNIYSNLTLEIFKNISKILIANDGVDLAKNTALQWQLEKMKKFKMLNDETIWQLAMVTGHQEDAIRKLIKENGYEVYDDTYRRVSNALGINRPYDPTSVELALNSLQNQVFRELDNFVNETMLTRNLANNGLYKTYKGVVEECTAKVVTGLYTKEQAISATIYKWYEKGVPSSFVDKAGREWSLEVYARMVVQTTTYRTFNNMRTQASEDLGVETFYMSTKPASREMCAPIQGTIVCKKSYDQLRPENRKYNNLNDYGYGEAGGTFGINCKHYLTPFIEGVNELPNDPQVSPDEAIENGKAQAKQRYYERAMRDCQNRINLAKYLGDDIGVSGNRIRLNNARKNLKQLLEKNPFLYRDSAREKGVFK
jgi:hypothetical protein